MNTSLFRLISFEMNGVKGISSPICIQFQNRIMKGEDFKKSAVKVIYGPNGAGKTAIITALYFYRRIVCDANAMNNPLFREEFYALANKKAESVFFRVSFAFRASKAKIYKFAHAIEFGIDVENQRVFIVKETLSALGANSKETPLFAVRDNRLIESALPSLKNLLFNRLDNTSIVARAISLKPSLYDKSEPPATPLFGLIATFAFASSLFVYFGSDENVLYRPYITPKPSDPSSTEELAKDIQDIGKEKDKRYLTSVRHEDYDEYVRHIECVKRFVQLFKPELSDIVIDARDFDRRYWINLTFVYENGSRVDFENESTGIKKIVTLSNALEALSRGAIVLIDEIDSGIMDKIISEVVGYACKYTCGQLLLTTHHVGLMGMVKKEKHSIDFLSTDSVLTKWTRNGNYNPEKVFLGGGIPHIPLNVNSFDFVDVFNGERDE